MKSEEPKDVGDVKRYEREREFHDARFAEDSRPANRFYGEAFSSAAAYARDQIDALPPAGHLLEFGCGHEAYAAVRAALAGHTAVAFDLSPVAVDEARERAAERGVAERIEFHVMNAEDVDLPGASFDLISGAGILHHLDLDRAFAQLARLLKPGGRAVFIEPLGHNPLINLYRRRTPGQRTIDEHPLRVSDFELAHDHFGEVRPNYFGLASLATLPLGRARHSAGLTRRLDAVDRALFRRFPRVGRYAWLVALDLRDPGPQR